MKTAQWRTKPSRATRRSAVEQEQESSPIMDLYRRRKIDAHIDLTPMIDTLLQLFMIFLLSASIVASSVELKLPQASVEQKSPQTPIVVSLNATNDLFLNDVALPQSELRKRL